MSGFGATDHKFPKHFFAKYQEPTPENKSLFQAALAGNATEIQALLGRGACMNWYNEEKGGMTAAHAAAESCDVASLRALADFRTDDDAFRFHVNIASTTLKARPLHISSASGDATSVKFVVSIDGVDIDARNSYGNTPLMLACVHNHLEVAEILIAAGADLMASNIPNKEMPIHMAIAGITARSRASSPNDGSDFVDLRIIMLLLKHGVDVNVADAYGSTPLHLIASIRENEALLALGHLLINKHGANPKLRDLNGRRPSDILKVRRGSGDLLKLFKRHELFLQ